MFRLRITGDLGFEFWQDIPGYEGIYQVSTYGRIKSLPKKTRKGTRLIKPTFDGGYYKVSLCKNGVITNYNVHRLVADTFIPNYNGSPQVDHIIPVQNGGTDRVENLRFVTIKENANNPISLKNKSIAQLLVSDKKREKMMGKCVKKVFQYNTNNELIAIYSSIKAVCERFGIVRWKLDYCMKQGKILFDSFWRYA